MQYSTLNELRKRTGFSSYHVNLLHSRSAESPCDPTQVVIHTLNANLNLKNDRFGCLDVHVSLLYPNSVCSRLFILWVSGVGDFFLKNLEIIAEL
jgi:hypothetical protein